MPLEGKLYLIYMFTHNLKKCSFKIVGIWSSIFFQINNGISRDDREVCPMSSMSRTEAQT